MYILIQYKYNSIYKNSLIFTYISAFTHTHTHTKMYTIYFCKSAATCQNHNSGGAPR